MRLRMTRIAAKSILALAALLPITLHGGLIVFATGLSLPEDLIVAPGGFSTFGGQYFIPDPAKNFAGPNNVYTVAANGGAATTFVTMPSGQSPVGDLFLTGAGTLSGQLLVSGGNFGRTTGFIAVVNSSGNITQIINNQAGDRYTTPSLAPAGFGAVAGDALVPREDGSVIQAVDPSGNVSLFASNIGINIWGSVFAPAGFGTIGGDLLVSSLDTGTIDAITSNGTVIPWATIPLGPANVGLRNMTFAPAGFGTLGGDLIISIAGGTGITAGTYGQVAAINSAGQVVAYLQTGTLGVPFDPRGIYFPNNQTILVNAVDPVYMAGPTDFAATPEPGTLLLAGVALALLGFRRKLSGTPGKGDEGDSLN